MNETVLIDKPAGWTSFDVVAKIRGAVRAAYKAQGIQPTKRQLKVGHAGTLDPFATGLLVVLLGDACSHAQEYLKLDKTYEATIRLGYTSSTGDPEGELHRVSNTQPAHEAVLGALKGLTGHIEQQPPAFSAIKINGQRAYKLARAGTAVVLPTREVTVYDFQLLEYIYPDIRVKAAVSSGTYIRTLAEDTGRALGTGAYCHALRRTNIGDWTIDDAVSLEAFLGVLAERSLPLKK